MFKPAQLAIGSTIVSISSASNMLMLDNNLYNRLVEVLGEEGTDHTYLRLTAGIIREIVKITYLSGGAATIVRSQDGTDAEPFAAGTYVEYEFCSAAVTDMIASLPANDVTITHEAPVTVTVNSPNNFTIGLEPVSITSNNGTINVSGSFPTVDLTVNASTLGLCNTGIGPSP